MGDVPVVVKSIFGDRFIVGPERESGVESNSQVADLRGWGYGSTIPSDEISILPDEWLKGHKHELRLVAVKLEDVGRHPGFNCLRTVVW